MEKGWITALITTFVILVILASGCIGEPKPTEVNVTNGVELGFILLDKEGTINQDLCAERSLVNKVIILESKYCSACKVVIPRLEEIEQELSLQFIWLDMSKAEDVERLKEFRVVPQYTPTVLIGCEVLIGAYPKDKYKQLIMDTLQSE